MSAPVIVDPAAAAPDARRLRRGLVGALAVGLIGLLAMVGVAIWLTGQQRLSTYWVHHTYDVESGISDLQTEVEKIENARRGYLLDQTAIPLGVYRQAAANIPPMIAHVQQLTRDNPRQQANIGRLRPLIEAKLVRVKETIDLAQAGEVRRAVDAYVASHDPPLMVALRNSLHDMRAEEARLLNIRLGKQRADSLALLATVILTAVVVVVVAIGCLALIMRYARDLGRSQESLRRLNEGLEAAVRDRTAELTRANEEIQRFAYIVSHDLRSPLVNVMGFTSELEAGVSALGKLLAKADTEAPGLVDRESRGFIQEEIPEAIGFIRSSTRKMDRLINAILKLSREGRRTLNPEPLAMDSLAHGVADSLRQLAEARGAAIAVEEPLPDLVNDRVAIEQLISNLTENAVKYLSPQRPGRIVIRGRAEGTRATLEVEDNGRGIDPKDHQRIFDLFRRSGQQDQPGEGIGLAHVRALVYRLGGHITVDSELGRGSIFRIELPRRLERETAQAA
ncbi:MAG: CHASE3 domain-containing protein [Caulobacteraceae bacterium]|nr:CHASE3 domain-containing protein [Caulobacter sp.]